MQMNGRKKIGVVVECYDYDETHQVVVARSREVRIYYFFFLEKKPQVGFGDILIMNFVDEKYYVRRGDSKPIFKLTSLDFPGSLLWESIMDRMED